MIFGSLWRRVGRIVTATAVRGRPAWPQAGPVCRLTIDLDRVPWRAHPEPVLAELRVRPGVLDVHVDARRVVVIHDSRASIPELWNWLITQPGPSGR